MRVKPSASRFSPEGSGRFCRGFGDEGLGIGAAKSIDGLHHFPVPDRPADGSPWIKQPKK
jgi:hypothetical protein